MVAGASKRGWTTWLVGAVDKRVIAMCPLVMDLLNLVKNIHHHYQAYGGWSFALQDYYSLNFTTHLDDPNVQLLADIVDPYSYLDRLTMPKLVIDAGGDEFFLPDDEFYWWDDLPEPKYFLMVPNAEHSLATGIIEVLASVSAFINGVLDGDTLPQFSWSIDYPNTGSITLTSTPSSTQGSPNVTLWVAASAPGTGRRDFRLVAGYPNPTLQPVLWEGFSLPCQPDGVTWIGTVPAPSSGWLGFFLDVQYEGPKIFNGQIIPYEFTTQVSIVPNTFPFPPCFGVGCYGHLL